MRETARLSGQASIPANTSAPNDYKIRPSKGILRVLYPIPSVVFCGVGICKGSGKGEGGWKGQQRHLDTAKHIAKKHAALAPFKLAFKCQGCRKEFTSIHTVGRHQPFCSGVSGRETLQASTSGSLLEPLGELTVDKAVVADTVNGGFKLTLLYPGRPSLCPCAPECEWYTEARHFRVMGSIVRLH